MAIKITENGVVRYENEPNVDRLLFPNTPDCGHCSEQIGELKENLTDLQELADTKAAAIYETASGSIASFSDGADDMPMKSCMVNIEPIQEGTGNPSPENVRPISGRTGLSVVRSGKNLLPDQGETYSVNWETEAGTVYGGVLDVVSGKLVVDRTIFTEGGSSNVQTSQANRFYITKANAVMINAGNQNTEASVISDRFTSTTWEGLANSNWRCSPVWGTGVAFAAEEITTAQDWKDYFAQNPTQFSYKLATPIEIQLTPQEVRTLLGANNIWSNAGSMTVEYPADTKMYIDQKITEAIAAALA